MASEVAGPRQCCCGPREVVVTIKQDEDIVGTIQALLAVQRGLDSFI